MNNPICPTKDLTPLEKAFAEEYLTNGFNGTRAYLKINPAANYDSARAYASTLMNRAHVRSYLSELSDKQSSKVTKTLLLNEAREITIMAKDERNYSAALKGNELSGRYIGAFDSDEDAQMKYVQFIQQIAGDNITVNIGQPEKKETVIDGDVIRDVEAEEKGTEEQQAETEAEGTTCCNTGQGEGSADSGRDQETEGVA